MIPRVKLSSLLLVTSGAFLVGFGVWRIFRPDSTPTPAAPAVALAQPEVIAANTDAAGRRSSPSLDAFDLADLRAVLERKLRQPGARPGEALLTFKDARALQDFLGRAGQAGVTVLGRLDGLLLVRVRVDSLDAWQRELLAHGDAYGQIAANALVGIPQPVAEQRAARVNIPLGSGLLAFLGVTGETGTWGRGVTVAILDSGVAADATFGQGRLRALDIGLGTAPGALAADAHGTSVAALAAGASPDARGVAPGASLLSIRVTDESGTSDVFTVAQAIIAAVEAGAQVINVSLGGYATSGALSAAIDYADKKGAVIVAAAGNDQAAQLTWPAADTRVVSVGAVDAIEQQVLFSNSGPQLQITAPGYGVETAGADGTRILFSGTSASTPIVAGALAAVMSQTPGLSAADAWKVLQQHANDAGQPGTDPDYGNGVLNVGWAMTRADPTRVDTAISSLYHDTITGRTGVVVQNRGARPVASLTLEVEANGSLTQVSVPWLGAGATQTLTLSQAQSTPDAEGRLVLRTVLSNPLGVTDQVPANNQKTSALVLPKK